MTFNDSYTKKRGDDIHRFRASLQNKPFFDGKAKTFISARSP